MEITTSINLIIAGIGGQGILLASEILAQLALGKGYDVKKSEVHGMAQRGGSVITHVRWGNKIYSPLIRKGEADYILGLEKLETWRASVYARPEATIIFNTQEVPPLPVILGTEVYPSGIEEFLYSHFPKVVGIDGQKYALRLESARTINIFFLGVLARFLEFDLANWKEVLHQKVSSKYHKQNWDAFQLGYQEGEMVKVVPLKAEVKGK